jgi:predicted transcriptional regulator
MNRQDTDLKYKKQSTLETQKLEVKPLGINDVYTELLQLRNKNKALSGRIQQLEM